MFLWLPNLPIYSNKFQCIFCVIMKYRTFRKQCFQLIFKLYGNLVSWFPFFEFCLFDNRRLILLIYCIFGWCVFFVFGLIIMFVDLMNYCLCLVKGLAINFIYLYGIDMLINFHNAYRKLVQDYQINTLKLTIHLQQVAEEEEMRQQIQASAVNMSMRARGRQTPLENGGSEVS